MCRICGRMVKCIFDTMPSRIHHVPSRRAFTTVRRIPATQSHNQLILRVQLPPTQSTTITTTTPFIRAFSALSLRSSNVTPFQSLTRPSLSSVTTSSTISPMAIAGSSRAFSSSAMMGAKRNTYNPSRRVQKRRHGYLARLKSKTGIMMLKRRSLKGRKDLSW